ncbi:hypothetical protein ACJX0J_015643, partial [Zea mays]
MYNIVIYYMCNKQTNTIIFLQYQICPHVSGVVLNMIVACSHVKEKWAIFYFYISAKLVRHVRGRFIDKRKPKKGLQPQKYKPIGQDDPSAIMVKKMQYCYKVQSAIPFTNYIQHSRGSG